MGLVWAATATSRAGQRKGRWASTLHISDSARPSTAGPPALLAAAAGPLCMCTRRRRQGRCRRRRRRASAYRNEQTTGLGLLDISMSNAQTLNTHFVAGSCTLCAVDEHGAGRMSRMAATTARCRLERREMVARFFALLMENSVFHTSPLGNCRTHAHLPCPGLVAGLVTVASSSHLLAAICHPHTVAPGAPSTLHHPRSIDNASPHCKLRAMYHTRLQPLPRTHNSHPAYPAPHGLAIFA